MDAQLINYGEQFCLVNCRIGNLDDELVQMGMNHERFI